MADGREARPCTFARCGGSMVVLEEGVLNGVTRRYWMCQRCERVTVEDVPPDDDGQQQLALGDDS